ncbi:YggT family protein [Desulfurivibrio dismutans]|uniref:YggT family protein n=1 Tax=Desulfurivibrio dismutans TaxID=1398908 RepID=UPI0023DA45E6|nr:YggT family protein [Desulfurivibrio alkaliphilus]MDF1615630.1 YggT family protein [Desulfurivibrio alkaliphilus]
MFIISNFLNALAGVINVVFSVYIWVILGRVIISWVNADQYNPIVRFLYEITEPPLRVIRRYLPVMGGFDFAPLVLILGIIFLQSFLVPTLQQLARAFG